MAGNSPEEIAKVKKAFKIVGAILGVCTVLTVAVAVWAPLDFGAHGFDTADMVIGLIIATFKASMVALIFMHLRFGHWEKKTILWIFFGGLFIASAMISILTLAEFNPITYKGVLPYGSDLPETQVDQAYDLDQREHINYPEQEVHHEVHHDGEDSHDHGHDHKAH